MADVDCGHLAITVKICITTLLQSSECGWELGRGFFITPPAAARKWGKERKRERKAR